jgi:hypothetical protein
MELTKNLNQPCSHNTSNFENSVDNVCILNRFLVICVSGKRGAYRIGHKYAVSYCIALHGAKAPQNFSNRYENYILP